MRLTGILAGENNGLVGGVSRGDHASVLAKEAAHPVETRTDADVLSEIKARLQQDAWISGRGCLY